MKKLIVNKKYGEKRLSKYLLDNVQNLTYGLFSNTLRRKDIKLNGKRINKDIIVHEGDEINLYISEEVLNNKRSIGSIEKFYEDDNILILNKPINIEVTGEQSLTTIIQEQYKNTNFKPMPCHRLDRNTTGLVIFAKKSKALEILLDKFKKHEIEKHYIAKVYGIPYYKFKREIAYLFKDNKKSKVYISNIPRKGYSKIITEYKVLKINKEENTTILDVKIETGKTHQIRAHLAYMGYPILGDGKYGKNEINKKFNEKYQMLCAYKLKFNFKTDAGMLNYLNKMEIEVPVKF